MLESELAAVELDDDNWRRRRAELTRLDPAAVAVVGKREIGQSPSVRRAAEKARAARKSFMRKRPRPAQTSGSDKPRSEEDKHIRRLEQNHFSAAAARFRRDAYIAALEDELTSRNRQGVEGATNSLDRGSESEQY